MGMQPLHPTPYSLHPTPYTLHYTPYTLDPQPSTLNQVVAGMGMHLDVSLEIYASTGALNPEP